VDKGRRLTLINADGLLWVQISAFIGAYRRLILSCQQLNLVSRWVLIVYQGESKVMA